MNLNISDSDSALKLFEGASKNRTTASTLLNSESSRSHIIFTIYLKNSLNDSTTKFIFIDLAGSEKPSKSKDQKSFDEGVAINKGLFILEKIINNLSNGEKAVFRGSNLIQILQDSLGGKSSTLFIACINPLRSNSSESFKNSEICEQSQEN